MIKPENECEIRLTDAEVRQAVEMWINEQQFQKYLQVEEVRKTRSNNWFLIARFK